jgi:hypothetical protein
MSSQNLKMTAYHLEFMMLQSVELSDVLNVPRVPNWSTIHLS